MAFVPPSRYDVRFPAAGRAELSRTGCQSRSSSSLGPALDVLLLLLGGTRSLGAGVIRWTLQLINHCNKALRISKSRPDLGQTAPSSNKDGPRSRCGQQKMSLLNSTIVQGDQELQIPHAAAARNPNPHAEFDSQTPTAQTKDIVSGFHPNHDAKNAFCSAVRRT